MKIETAPVHAFAIEELACKITGLDYEEIDADTAIIEDKCMQEFNIDLDSLGEIVSRLLPLIGVAKGAISKKEYKGFIDKDSGTWLIKTEL